MGRGIAESGLFRSERYQLERRTSDPATTQEGEMWIRTDLAPDANQLATLRFDAGASTWDVPIYDVAATTTNVEKVWRVTIGGTTGFVPITDDFPTFSALKFQHNGAAFGAHDALTASAIPDSGVSRWEFEQNVLDSWGTNDGSDNTSAGYTTDAAVGTYAKSYDGTDDLVTVSDDTTLDLETLSVSAWFNAPSGMDVNANVIAKQESGGDFDGWQISLNDGFGFASTAGGLQCNFRGGGTSAGVGGDTDLRDGTWHHVVGTRDGATGDVVLYLDGSELASTTGHTNSIVTAVDLAHGAGADGSAFWGGDTDDPRIYDKVLSGTEVSNLYQTGSING